MDTQLLTQLQLHDDASLCDEGANNDKATYSIMIQSRKNIPWHNCILES